MLNNEQMMEMLSNMGIDIRMLQIQVGILLDLLAEGFGWEEDKKEEVGERMKKAFDDFLEQVEKISNAKTITLPDGSQKPVIFGD